MKMIVDLERDDDKYGRIVCRTTGTGGETIRIEKPVSAEAGFDDEEELAGLAKDVAVVRHRAQQALSAVVEDMVRTGLRNALEFGIERWEGEESAGVLVTVPLESSVSVRELFARTRAMLNS